MSKNSKVLEFPPMDSQTAYQHFCQKLALETDPSDVYTDIRNGAADFILVDVRNSEAYNRSHAIGAINIPHTEISETQLVDFPKETLFIVYCWGRGCNGADKAAMKLSALGRAVKIMIGGIEYWEDKECYPVKCG